MSEGANVTIDFDTDRIDELFRNLRVVAKVGYTADYAGYVEFPTSYAGTQPPFAPLREWVDNKWQDLDAGLKSVPLEGNDDMVPNSEEHKNAVAWVVVMSIADTGTDGVFFLRRGFEAAKDAAEQFAASYADTDDLDAARKIFTDTFDFAFQTSQDIVADEATDEGNLLQSGFVIITKNGDTVFEETG